MNAKLIAQVCHEANRALCATHGDTSQPASVVRACRIW
jgi:hypothetical protein